MSQPPEEFRAALASVDHQVAVAADAWLTDPTNTGAYARLVAAVRERRSLVLPPAEHPRDAVEPAGDDADADEATAADDQRAVVTAVGEDLVGDPRAVLDRLRRGL